MKQKLQIETVNWSKRIVDHNSLWADYLGVHADKYLRAREILKIRKSKIYWNWPAAVLGPIWLFYRKLYAPLFIWLLIAIPFDFVYWASPGLDPNLNNPLIAIVVNHFGPLSFLYVLVTNLLVGCWGTYGYLQQAEWIVALVKSKTPNTIAAIILSQKGNPSSWRLAGGFILIPGIYLLTILLGKLYVGGCQSIF
ncbi:MAG: DUF2628 domain-containing protein [Syntrophomonas sp.]|nr:DUF2628 domain-containing protein [Syntrophomonas sp.]